MLKQWKNNNLNVIYFHIPNSKNDEILTNDGVLIPFEEFKIMDIETYNKRKSSNSGYDYELSRQSERLVKKVIKPSNDFTQSSNSLKQNNHIVPDVKIENEIKDDIQTELPKTKTKKVIKIPKENNDNQKDKINVSAPKEKIETTVQTKENIKSEKKEINLFDFLYPKLMLILAVICSSLSIYFTGTYLQRLQSKTIAYAISTAMLVYGLIGSQMARRATKKKHKLQAFIYAVTSICTISFSMASAIDVNYAKYKLSHSEIEQQYNSNDGIKISYDILKDELEENKKQITLLNEDIKFQQTQWSIIWDNELNKNIVLEGRISATAQQKITDDNNSIKELVNRNKEINEKLMEFAESGISVEIKETKTDRAKSLTDLIGGMFGISGNIIQLIFLLIPSFFIDIIGILSLSIYLDRFEDKEK